jgi:hypothetical protein
MKWTKEFGEKVLAVLKQKIEKARCPLCGSASWSLIGYSPIVIQEELTHYNILGTLKTIPTVSLTCQVCGNTHQLNLKVLAPDLAKEVFKAPSETEGDKKQ